MNLGQQHAFSIRRETYHNSFRRQDQNLKLTKQRHNITTHLHKLIYQNSANEKVFNEQTFQNLIHLMMQDTKNGYIMLGNYVCDFHQQTSYRVFQIVKDMKSTNPMFAWVVRLSLFARDVDYSQIINHIDTFLDSPDLKVVEYGCKCVQVLLEKEEYRCIVFLKNLKSSIQKHIVSENKEIASGMAFLFLKLLLLKECRYSLISNNTSKLLLRLLKKSLKSRDRTLEVLKVLYSDFDFHIEDIDIIKELIFLHYSSNGQLLYIVSEVWQQFIVYQSFSNIRQALQIGLVNSLGAKIQHPDVTIVYKTLCILQKICQIISISGQQQFLSGLINFFENEFELSRKLQEMMQHQNHNISLKSKTILESYYTTNSLDKDFEL